jgi:hypothetical protein
VPLDELDEELELELLDELELDELELEVLEPTSPEEDEEELEDELEDELPEDDEDVLVPGVMPPLEQPCKATKPAVIRIKEIFFILTILTNCVRHISYAACRTVEFRRFSEKSWLIIGYNSFIVRQVAKNDRKPDLVLNICGHAKHQTIHTTNKKRAYRPPFMFTLKNLALSQDGRRTVHIVNSDFAILFNYICNFGAIGSN